METHNHYSVAETFSFQDENGQEPDEGNSYHDEDDDGDDHFNQPSTSSHKNKKSTGSDTAATPRYDVGTTSAWGQIETGWDHDRETIPAAHEMMDMGGEDGGKDEEDMLLQQRRDFEKEIDNELSELLSVGIGGMNANTAEFQFGEMYMQSLRRVENLLRRSDGPNRIISRKFEQWATLKSSFLPLLQAKREEAPVVLMMVKILCRLTMPLEGEKLKIDPELNGMLHQTKAALVRPDCQALTIVMTQLVLILSVPSERRNEIHSENIELILTLFKNLLTIPDPKASAVSSAHMAHLQDKTIKKFFDEEILETLLNLIWGQDDDITDTLANTVLEICYHFFRQETGKAVLESPELLNRHSKQFGGVETGFDTLKLEPEKKKKKNIRGANTLITTEMKMATNRLTALKNAEMTKHKKMKRAVQRRHGRWSSQYALKLQSGETKIVRNIFASGEVAAVEASAKLTGMRGGFRKAPLADTPPRRYFDRRTMENVRSTAKLLLYEGRTHFNELVASLMTRFKNEIHTTPKETLMHFMFLANFCLEFHRIHMRKEAKSRSDSSKYASGPVAKMLEHEMFIFVYQQICDILKNKEIAHMKVHHDYLAVAVTLYKEMLRGLAEMIRVGSSEQRQSATRIFREMFRDNESLRVFSGLLRDYMPHQNNQNYLAVLVEAVHYLINMLTHLLVESQKSSRDNPSGKSGAKGAMLTTLTKKRRKSKRKPKAPQEEAKANEEKNPDMEGEAEYRPEGEREGESNGAPAEGKQEEKSAENSGERGASGAPDETEGHGERHEGGEMSVSEMDGGEMSLEQMQRRMDESVMAFSAEGKHDEPRGGDEFAAEGEIEEENAFLASSSMEYVPRREKKVSLDHFVMQEFFNNKIINNYMLLLPRYKTNSEKMNSYLISFFMRVKSMGFEPFFYRLSAFAVFERILSDRAIRNVKEFAMMRKFCKGTWRSFRRRLVNNPLLIVEALFTKPRALVEELCEDPGSRKKREAEAAAAAESRYKDAYLEDLTNNPDEMGAGDGGNASDFGGEEEYNPTKSFTSEEDDKIKEQFVQLKDSPMCAAMIASQLDNRSELEVGKRLERLGLVAAKAPKKRSRKRRSVISMEDEEQEEGEFGAPSASGKRRGRKRLRRGFGDDSIPDRRFDPSDPATKLEIRNTIRLMKRSSSNSDGYDAALKYVIDQIQLCQEIAAEFSENSSEDQPKSLQSALTEEDFAIVPFSEEQFAWLALPHVARLLKILSLRRPSAQNGEMYWRVPNDISSAHLTKMCSLIESAISQAESQAAEADDVEKKHDDVDMKDGSDNELDATLDLDLDLLPKKKNKKKKKSRKRLKKKSLDDDDDDEDEETVFTDDEDFDMEFSSSKASNKSESDKENSASSAAPLSAETYVPSFISRKNQRRRRRAEPVNNENDQKSANVEASPVKRRKRLRKPKSSMLMSDSDSDDYSTPLVSLSKEAEQKARRSAESLSMAELVDDNDKEINSRSNDAVFMSKLVSDMNAGEGDSSAQSTPCQLSMPRSDAIEASETCGTNTALGRSPGSLGFESAQNGGGLESAPNSAQDSDFPMPGLASRKSAPLPPIPDSSLPSRASQQLSKSSSQSQSSNGGPLTSLSLSDAADSRGASSQSAQSNKAPPPSLQAFDSLEVNLSVDDDDSDEDFIAPRTSKSKRHRNMILDMGD